MVGNTETLGQLVGSIDATKLMGGKPNALVGSTDGVELFVDSIDTAGLFVGSTEPVQLINGSTDAVGQYVCSTGAMGLFAAVQM